MEAAWAWFAAGLRWVPASSMNFFFRCLSEAPRTRFGVHLEVDSDGKMAPKIEFQGLFSHTFFLNILLLIFDCFWKAPNPYNCAPACTGAWFLQNKRFQKELTKVRFGDPFWQTKCLKISENSMSENDVFWESIFNWFLWFSCSQMAPRTPPKNCQKLKNSQ